MLSSGEHRSKICLGQDAGNFRTLVALDFDLAILHRAASAAGTLHRPGQLLLFRQSDADKTFHHRHGLAAAPGRLPDDVHAPAMLPHGFRCLGWGEATDEPALGDARPTRIFRCGREPGAGQGLREPRAGNRESFIWLADPAAGAAESDPAMLEAMAREVEP